MEDKKLTPEQGARTDEVRGLDDAEMEKVAGGNISSGVCEKCGRYGLEYKGAHVWACPYCGAIF